MEFKKCKSCNGSITTENEKYNLVKCDDCKLVFSRKEYLVHELKEVYDILYNKADSPQYAKHSLEEYNQLQNGIIDIGYNRKRIIDNKIKGGNVLEIGSGVGLIGLYLKRNSKINYVGIEFDEKAHEKALSLGVNSVNGSFEYMANLKEKFDYVMLWEVLEHLQDTSMFFTLLKERLINGGKLILSIPNYDKRLNYEPSEEIYQSPPPIHLNFFTKSSIREILEKNNFEIESINIKRFPYMNLKSNKFYKNVLKSFLGNYHGSTIYVVAKFKGL